MKQAVLKFKIISRTKNNSIDQIIILSSSSVKLMLYGIMNDR